MQKAGSCFFTLQQVVLFAVIGGIIGLFAGRAIVPLYRRGLFTPWHHLRFSNRINHIVATKNYAGILVQMENGKYFSYFYDFGEWVEIKSSSVSYSQAWDGWSQASKTDCSFKHIESWDAAPPLPPLIRFSRRIECAFTEFWYEDKYVGVYYVLLDNGNLWMWKIERDAFTGISIFFAVIILGTYVGGIYGMTQPQ